MGSGVGAEIGPGVPVGRRMQSRQDYGGDDKQGTDCDHHPEAARAEHEEQEQRPEQVELLLHGQRPQMGEGQGEGGARGRQPVAGVEDDAEQAPYVHPCSHMWRIDFAPDRDVEEATPSCHPPDHGPRYDKCQKCGSQPSGPPQLESLELLPNLAC